jgi:hypothetical protein
MGASYNQKDAEGFIRLLGLPARTKALVNSKTPKFGVGSETEEANPGKSEVVK